MLNILIIIKIRKVATRLVVMKIEGSNPFSKYIWPTKNLRIITEIGRHARNFFTYKYIPK